MPREVAVVAAGHTRFGDLRRTAKDLFTEAALQCFESGRVDPGRVEEAWVGSLGFGGWQIGNLAALLAEHGRLPYIPARRVENACASGGFAFRDAYLAVRSGAVRVALAGGVEVMNDLSPLRQRYWLGVSGDTEWERLAGLTFPGVYALMARRHMEEFGTTREHLAAVAVKNHRHGARNSNAQYRREITVEDVLQAPPVAAPLGLYDCCGVTDGATCVVLASKEVARDLTDAPVWVLGSGAGTDHLALHDRESITGLSATVRAAKAALREAGVGIGDVDVAEVHDCFTIAEVMAVEDLGWCPKGQGGPFTASGATGLDGQVALNPSGGLKAKGHPLGATGTGQVVEIFRQIRGEAGDRQRVGAETGLTHNVGGSGATCAVHVFGV